VSKFLIAGLGNIGEEYAFTRHNIGFDIADALAKKLQPDAAGKLFHSDKLAAVNHSKYKGKQVVIIKPTTYMNLSGKAVNYWLQAEKIPLHHLLVVTDDLALPFGTLRLKKKGSDGGHNGMADIAETLNTIDYHRLRFGIGSEFNRGKQVDYVLSKWSKDEEAVIDDHIQKACDIILSFIAIGADRTMTAFNKK